MIKIVGHMGLTAREGRDMERGEDCKGEQGPRLTSQASRPDSAKVGVGHGAAYSPKVQVEAAPDRNAKVQVGHRV